MVKISSTDTMEKIQKARPNLKPNSIKQYEAHLKKLQKVYDTDNYNFLDNPSDVMDKLSDKHYTSIRNTLNAVIILLMALNHDEKYNKLIEDYQKERDKLNDKYLQDQQSGKISEKQKKNFAELSEVQSMIKKMEKEIKEKEIKKKSSLKVKERELMMVYTIYNILIRIPTRNDMAGMELITKTGYNKLTEDQKKNTNYLVKEKSKMFFVLNEYKTSKKYGEKKIDIPKDLEKILRSYIKVMDKKPGDVLFTSSTGNPISRNSISQLLMKTSKNYLNKSISTTMMRKIVVSDKFGAMIEEQKKLADAMGHDVNTQNLVYVKEK
jgi:hypothetical protein